MDNITQLWTLYTSELHKYIYSKVKNEADSDDILQDVFVKVTLNQEKVLAANDVRNYIFGITKNTLFLYFKSKSKEGQLVISDERETELPLNMNEIIGELCLRPLMDQLPNHYKEALISAEFSDTSQIEIAKKLDISYSCFKSRVQRGREKLKELITQNCLVKSDTYGNLTCQDKLCDQCN